ncbi:hypothetical protein RU97_GL000930 [Enterococcus canis]|uniref:Cobalt transporter n=1 Tax=Enterococcus canis TaxID=214095 RepID=A0A1L8RHW8_9ENTE|nr:energy-coupling factor transporter transmembrane component T [Enterococcus canis]OJG19359.1 hypothetical protein RU97_GL000930 [Enterococcus canis]
MKKKDAFGQTHPLVSFLYYVLVIGISMFCLHPAILLLSLVSGMLYAVRLKGFKAVMKMNLKFLLPGMLVVAVVNPAFNHYGVTPLLYLNNGNTVTLEAIVYGLALALVLAISLTWFTTYNVIMTSDKFIYLFGRLIPASSLILSMVFRFIPKFSQQLQVVRNGQKSIGRDASNGNLWQKLKHALTTFSIMITWSLENAIDTADSMKARGYGLKGRTAFSLYRLDRRDKGLLCWLTLTSLLFFWSWWSGSLYVSYNPQIIISGWPLTFSSFSGIFAFLLLANLPLFLGLLEDYQWRKLTKTVTNQTNLPYYFTTGGFSHETSEHRKF